MPDIDRDAMNRALAEKLGDEHGYDHWALPDGVHRTPKEFCYSLDAAVAAPRRSTGTCITCGDPTDAPHYRYCTECYDPGSVARYHRATGRAVRYARYDGSY